MEITSKMSLTSSTSVFRFIIKPATEIAMSRDGRFVAIDYVNDQPDLRPQSKTPDGVPDQVLDKIVKDTVDWVRQCVRGI